jgi:hypothetical protein
VNPIFLTQRKQIEIIERQNKEINRHITDIPFVEEEQQADIPHIIAVEKSFCLEENIMATLKKVKNSL